MAHKKTVLVISALPSGQTYLEVLMKRMWHFPVLARTAAEGLRISENVMVNLALLDGSVPESDLVSAVRLFRRTQVSRDIPLVVVLPVGQEHRGEELLREGCSAVLAKPIDFSVAYGLLNRIIDQFRTTPRIPLKVPVAIEEAKPESSLASVDVSEGGIYLRTPDPLPEGSVLHLTFALPHEKEPIWLPAEVVRAFSLGDRHENEPGMGLRFLEVTDAVRAKLRNYTQWQMMGDLEWGPGLTSA